MDIGDFHATTKTAAAGHLLFLAEEFPEICGELPRALHEASALPGEFDSHALWKVAERVAQAWPAIVDAWTQRVYGRSRGTSARGDTRTGECATACTPPPVQRALSTGFWACPPLPTW